MADEIKDILSVTGLIILIVSVGTFVSGAIIGLLHTAAVHFNIVAGPSMSFSQMLFSGIVPAVLYNYYILRIKKG